MVDRVFGTFGAAAVVSLLLLAPAAMAERAAGIEYEFVDRPAGVPGEFQPGPDAGVSFLKITAIDGSRVDGALTQPKTKAPADSVLILSVHGSGGSFHGDPNGFLARLLASKGYAVLGINTRQSGSRVNTDSFLEIRRDIEAGIYTARALGYRAMVLHGHSLGNIHVQYYAANNWDSDVKAVVLTGMFANLPWKSRYVLIQNEESFAQLHAAALKTLREGKPKDVLPMRMGWITGQSVPITGQHFLTYRAESSSTADGTYWIRRVPYPVLMVRDEGDMVIQSFEPQMLLSAATAPGSLVPGIRFVSLPNRKGPNPAGHVFTDNQQPLADTIAAWLREQKL
jgi:pimeloyl-ACP methyl ester carboxylesterase